jgi:hypothetical protein
MNNRPAKYQPIQIIYHIFLLLISLISLVYLTAFILGYVVMVDFSKTSPMIWVILHILGIPSVAILTLRFLWRKIKASRSSRWIFVMSAWLLITGFLAYIIFYEYKEYLAPQKVLTTQLSYMIGVETPKGTLYLQINQDKVVFSSCKNCNPYLIEVEINRDNYPKLFSQGLIGGNVLEAHYIKNSSEGFIRLTNRNPLKGKSHNYYINIDLKTGKITEG